jgi:hypothetical protein
MTTRFAIGDIVLFDNSESSYEFEVTEIRIDHDGIFYSGQDAGGMDDGAVGWHKEKFLTLVS